MRPLPDVRPSELVKIVAEIRAGGAVPDLPMVKPRQAAHKTCQITCIVTDETAQGQWCERCPYS